MKTTVRSLVPEQTHFPAAQVALTGVPAAKSVVKLSHL